MFPPGTGTQCRAVGGTLILVSSRTPSVHQTSYLRAGPVPRTFTHCG